MRHTSVQGVRRFAYELNVGCGRKKNDKVDSRVLGLSNQKELPTNSAGNPREERAVRKIKNSVLYLLNLNCL